MQVVHAKLSRGHPAPGGKLEAKSIGCDVYGVFRTGLFIYTALKIQLSSTGNRENC